MTMLHHSRNTSSAMIWLKSAPLIRISKRIRLTLTPFVSASFNALHTLQLTPAIPTTGKILTAMLPLLMMRHRRISRTKWKDCQTSNGKHWIEQVRRLTMRYTMSLVDCLSFACQVLRRYATRKVPSIHDRISSDL